MSISNDMLWSDPYSQDSGRVVSTTDPLGNTTTFAYDAAGRQTEQTDPLGNTTTRSYDDAGRLISTTDPLGNTTTYEYYADGSLKKQTDPEGNTVRYTYDDAGRQVEVTDKDGETTQYSYDAAGRMTETTDPRGNTTSYTYDEVGNRTAVTDPDGNTTQYEYSDGDHLMTIIDPEGYITSYDLNADGSHASMTDKLGRTTEYEYDGLGRRIKTADPLGNTVEKKYDGEGNLLWVQDQNGNKTEYSYDQAGRRTEELFADGKSKTFEYNLAGYLTAETDQNGSVINNMFDAAGRLTERDIDRADGVVGTTEQTFTYDAAGRMIASSDNNDPADPDSTVETSKTYDALGRVTEETTAGYTVQSTYDGSRRTEIDYPGGTVVTHSHDAAGNLTEVKRDGELASSFTYDANNQVESQTFGNDVELTNERDSLYRITKREYHKDNTLVAGFNYDYDPMGNKEYQEDTRVATDSELYDYDELYRLIDWERGELNAEKDGIVNSVADQSWNLDPVGNWDETSHDGTVETRQHNEVNELIHRDNEVTTGLVYDDNGNLVEDNEHKYAYDAFNRLVEVLDRETGDTIATYRYDTENRRVWREANPEVGSPITVEYIYDGWQVVEEREVRGGQGRGGPRDGAGRETVRTYTYGNYNYIDEPLTMTTSRGDRTFYYHSNNLYNVRVLTDKNGDVVERYCYSAYGEPTVLGPGDNPRDSSIIGNVYMFQGRRYDAETALYYYRNRMMNAELGRFLQRDPLGYVDGWNLYEFVGGRPTMYSDPMGLTPELLNACIASCYEAYSSRLQAFQLAICMRQCKRMYSEKCCGSAKYNPAKGECCYDAASSTVGKLTPRWEVLGHSSWVACVLDIAGPAPETFAALGISVSGGIAAAKAQVMMIANRFPPTALATVVGWLGRAAIAERTCRGKICVP